MSEREPGEEELRAALEEQMRNIRVEDVIVQTVVTLVNLAGRRLGLAGSEDPKDAAQAKLAIDAARALVPLLPDEQTGPVRDALSQLQMAYVRETGAAAGAPAPGGEGTPAATSSPQAGPAQSPEEAERAKARAKLWTPPGT
ncbi:MAG: hypothetical protein NVSMB25_01320 [Thermoleophilaceae bacterium]